MGNLTPSPPGRGEHVVPAPRSHRRADRHRRRPGPAHHRQRCPDPVHRHGPVHLRHRCRRWCPTTTGTAAPRRSHTRSRGAGRATCEENGFPVTAGPNGHVVVTLTFWRPQRAPIPPETAPWIDIGHLSYGVPSATRGTTARSSSFSNPSPSLVAHARILLGGRNAHRPGQRSAGDPANTLSFTVDLTGCLAATGSPSRRTQTAPRFALVAETCGGQQMHGHRRQHRTRRGEPDPLLQPALAAPPIPPPVLLLAFGRRPLHVPAVSANRVFRGT